MAHLHGTNGPVETELPLSGFGVGPIFSAVFPPGGSLDFGEVPPGGAPVLGVEVDNTTSDEDGGAPELTRLTLRAELTGPDASSFEIVSAPTAVDAGAVGTFDVTPTGVRHGPVSAELTIYCDEDLPLGETTAVCAVVPLQAVALSVMDVPDLSTTARLLMVLAFAVLGLALIRRI